MSAYTKFPDGYTNWLDYAIATMDVRSVQQELLDSDSALNFDVPSYADLRLAASDELIKLRALADGNKYVLENALAALELMRFNGIVESEWDGMAIKSFDSAIADIRKTLSP